MRRIFFLFFFSLAACSHKPVEPETPALLPINECGKAPDCRLFPYGTYDQDISVTVIVDRKQENHEFSCLVRTSPDELALAGHAGMGMALFRIQQKNGQPVEFKTSLKQIERNREFFLKVFDLIKDIFSMKRTDPRVKNTRIALQPASLKANAQFFDFHEQIPQRVLVNSTEGLFEVRVKTRTFSENR